MVVNYTDIRSNLFVFSCVENYLLGAISIFRFRMKQFQNAQHVALILGLFVEGLTSPLLSEMKFYSYFFLIANIVSVWIITASL